MDYKKYFDIPEGITYLNTPGNGLIPRSHYEWRAAYTTAFFDPAGNLREQQYAFINSVTTALGRLFNCPKDNIYAVPNFSFGFTTLLEGLPKNFKYALISEDYPSLNYPVISRDLPHVIIASGENLENNIERSIEDHQPDVLLLSLVNYISGCKIDLDFIKRLKKENPNLIIIGDATQYLGTAPFDFLASGFDAIGTSGYKWMMAGFGNGALLLSNQLRSILYAKAQQGDRPKETMWANKSILDTFFIPGHQDTISHGMLLQSVLFFEELGLENIHRHITDISAYATHELNQRGLLLPEVGKRHDNSNLINIQIDPKQHDGLVKNGIKCTPRGSGIRIGIHFYNDRKDIDILLNHIDKLQ